MMIDFKQDEKIIAYFEKVLKNNKLSHAYLFVCDDDYYMENFISVFIKALFCERNNEKIFSSCEECNTCKNIENNNYRDLYIIDSNNQKIKKEETLLIKLQTQIKSAYGKKVYWLKSIEQMTPQAANSLLKNLEEPEENVFAILSCKNINNVLPTIISRCQKIKLVGKNDSKISDEEIIFSKKADEFLLDYKKNKRLAVLNALLELKTKEEVNYFLINFYKKIEHSFLNDKISSYDYVIVQEKNLQARRELEMNVAHNLVIESFFFVLLTKNIEIE